MQVARTADGYQPHLVSPENGMRELASEALEQMAGPVKACTNAVFTLLVNAAKCACMGALTGHSMVMHLSAGVGFVN